MTIAITEKLYGGKYTLTLDENHVYRLDHTDALPLGVTTPIKLIEKAFLGPWYAKECQQEICRRILEYAYDDDLGIRQIRMPLSEFEDMTIDAKFAAKRISDEAKDIGTQVHNFAEEYAIKQAAPMPEHPQAVKCCTALVEWFDRHRRTIIATERLVFSPTHFFAGKVDRIDEVDGELEVLDFKTSSGFYGHEFPIQLAGYAIAWEEEFGRHINWGTIVRIDKKTGQIEQRRYELTDRHKNCFLDLLAATKSLNKLEDMKNAARK